MQQTTTQLQAVEAHTSSKGRQYWKARDASNTFYAIFDAALAQTATALVNQSVTLTFETKQQGDYPPSHTLKSVAPSAVAIPVSQAPTVPAQNGGAAPVAAPQQVLHVTTTEDKSDRIERQSAYKAAVDHVTRTLDLTDEEEAFQWKRIQSRTEQLAYYAKHGRWMDTELPVPVAVADEDWA